MIRERIACKGKLQRVSKHLYKYDSILLYLLNTYMNTLKAIWKRMEASEPLATKPLDWIGFPFDQIYILSDNFQVV